MFLGVGIVLLTVVLNVVVPHRLRLIGTAALVVPQLWIPGLPQAELATVAVLWTLMTCLAGMAARGRPGADSPLVAIMGVFVVVIAVSLIWALPAGLGNGVSTVVRGAVFLLWLREIVVVAREDPQLVGTIAAWFVPGVAVQAVLAIAFRVSPAIEERFLQSNLAAIFVGPQAEQLFADMRNNVLYPFKSGGLYVNGNMASLFGAVAGLMLIVAARHTGQRWLYPVAALSIAGALFTGSKTALVLAPVCAIAIILLPHMLRGWVALVGIGIVLLVPLASSVATEFLQRYAPQFYTDSNVAVEGREPLWRAAEQLFWESPFLGLGFGGWTQQMARFTNRPELPPHNLLIATWANSGLVAAVVALVFMIAAITFAARVAAAQSTVRDCRTAIIALCALAWVFLHGMMDNTTIYGEQRSMMLVALVIGFLYSARQTSQNGIVKSDNRDGLTPRNLASAGPKRA